MNDVKANLAQLNADIAKVAQACGRTPGSARLVAVSKVQPVERVVAALEAGHRLFGENYVQEAQEKWTPLKAAWPDVRLHMIGPLQSNKADVAVRMFDCIESVDRPKLVHALATAMDKQGRRVPCLIQVNTGDESQKAGVAPDGLDDLLRIAREVGLSITGLMCIPPLDQPPALHFALLQKLAARHGLTELSMGMSADYAKAIPLGATLVRIGTALFGERVKT